MEKKLQENKHNFSQNQNLQTKWFSALDSIAPDFDDLGFPQLKRWSKELTLLQEITSKNHLK